MLPEPVALLRGCVLVTIRAIRDVFQPNTTMSGFNVLGAMFVATRAREALEYPIHVTALTGRGVVEVEGEQTGMVEGSRFPGCLLMASSASEGEGVV